MARDPNEKVRAAAEAVLVDGETVTSKGVCWAAQRRGRVPLPLLARRQYLLALTDRRVLVFERGRKPKPSDLVLGKRYETFSLEGVRRGFPLLQVRVCAANGNRMVFEFRPGQRELGGELVARLTPRAADADTIHEPLPGDTPTVHPDPPRPLEPLARADDDAHGTDDDTSDDPDDTTTMSAGSRDQPGSVSPGSVSMARAPLDPVSPWAPSTPSDELG